MRQRAATSVVVRPRQNKPRSVLAEEHLAERIAAERDARGWTNDGLARRMTDAGCPITGSAIFKIEKSQPRRRIVVDELVAFARVFGIPMEQLTTAPEVWQVERLAPLLEDWRQNIATGIRVRGELEDEDRRLRTAIREAAAVSESARAFVEDYLLQVAPDWGSRMADMIFEDERKRT